MANHQVKTDPFAKFALIVGLALIALTLFILLNSLNNTIEENTVKGKIDTEALANNKAILTSENLKSIGEVSLSDGSGAAAPSNTRSGEEVYKTVCAACHNTGAAAAPKIDDKAAWEPRVANGFEALLNTAINGKGAMPARGGQNVPDDELTVAIAYMTEKAGFSLDIPKATTEEKPADTTPAEATTEEKPADTTPAEATTEEKSADTAPAEATTEEKLADTTPAEATTEEKPADTTPAEATTEEKPADTTPAEATTEEKPADTTPAEATTEEKPADTTSAEATTEEKPADTTPTESSPTEEKKVEAPTTEVTKNTTDGEALYKKACFVCHDAGVANAPKLTDKEAWKPRIASGKEALYNSAINGKGAMPPKGGNASLSNDDIKAVVDYMVSTAQ